MAAAQIIDFLHLKFVVDASRLAYWLGKPVDAPRKSEKTAPSKLTHRKYFLDPAIRVFCILVSVQ